MKEITLPSGAKLKITLSPFAVSKALYLAALEEIQLVKLDANAEIESIFKDLFCLGFSSKKIEAKLADCMKRVTYNDQHITEDTFEPENARQDYMAVQFEVALANILPFTKDLTAQLRRFVASVKTSQQ